jgi:hypothetical protein
MLTESITVLSAYYHTPVGSPSPIFQSIQRAPEGPLW